MQLLLELQCQLLELQKLNKLQQQLNCGNAPPSTSMVLSHIDNVETQPMEFGSPTYEQQAGSACGVSLERSILLIGEAIVCGSIPWVCHMLKLHVLVTKISLMCPLGQRI